MRTTVTITLVIEHDGDASDALAVVNNALDEGVLQDAINDNPNIEAHVTSALAG